MISRSRFKYVAHMHSYYAGRGSSFQARTANTSFDIDVVTNSYGKKARHDTVVIRSKKISPEVYRMVLPPPNITGNLHIGHALTVTVEDAICRYRRLRGQQVTWYPGFDHAGIATQVVVETMLWNKMKLRRHEVTQSYFLELCRKWKQEYKNIGRTFVRFRRVNDISKQLKALGATLDWHNVYYTLDDKFSEAVKIAFCQLYDKGIIFNDLRMINWCPTLRSSISDQEVNIVDVGKSKSLGCVMYGCQRNLTDVGIMHLIRYELLSGDSFCGNNYLEVGTTRPETLFDDIALAVNPNDERYAKHIGSHVRHPFFPNRLLPVVADLLVNINKGTGVLKVAPTHGLIDFQIAKKHKDFINDEDLNRSCIDESGRLINTSDFDGIDRFEARRKIIDKLSACNKYGGTIPYPEHQLKICSRTGDVIEPMVKKQWFMNCVDMNNRALEAIENGVITIAPKSMQIHLENWLSKKEPWCLSRQLDWGQQIPAFRVDPNSEWIVALDKVEAQRACGRRITEIDLEQEKDVLDTWFCSALIPIVLSGWPKKEIKYVPLTMLETGFDIAGFWVARMITVCHSLTGYWPFSQVLLHGLVRDENGKKMSKSIGNIIDPMDVIDGISIQKMLERLNESNISEVEKKTASISLQSRFPKGIRRCGPDALRFALLRHDVTATDINIDIVQTAEEGLRFCNKLWNLCAYAKKLWESCREEALDDLSVHRIEDRWIQSRLESSLMVMTKKMESNSLHLAFNALHKFFCNDLCDVYIETTKKALWRKEHLRLKVIAENLHDIIEKSLVHLSIFMPFISEYLFDNIKRNEEQSVYNYLSERHLKFYKIDKKLEEDMSFVLELITAVRSIRSHFHIAAKNPLKVSCQTESCDLKNFESMIYELCNVTLRMTDPEKCNNHYIPFPLRGYSTEINVFIEDTFGSLIKTELLRRLQKAQKRKNQFLHRVEKHQKLAKSVVKNNSVECHERKIFQAKAVVNGMEEEILKLENLIKQSMDIKGNFKDLLLAVVCVFHITIAPYTKVEESFNVQAYDHHKFPGVVPRTFTGALALSAPLLPVVHIFEYFNISKYWMLYGMRLVLGLSVLFAFIEFIKRIDKQFGQLSGDFLRLLTATQFHFMFYCSRPLPNIFALYGGKIFWTYQKILDRHWICAAGIATVFTLLFRCELILFYACIFFYPILTRKFSLFSWNGAVVYCCFVAFLALGISIPIDSYLWRRWLWPEGEVWWFNVILNRSKEYGVLPFSWYFYSAIPRALSVSCVFVPIGLISDRRLAPIVTPVLLYVLLYSFLPHKELRFIIYAIPILNVSVAVCYARIWISRRKSLFRMLLAVAVLVNLLLNIICTAAFLFASSKNYPGAEALVSLQHMQRSDHNKPVSVYIDTYAAQTGVCRFLQLYDTWEYNKTENLKSSQMERFDFLILGSYTESDITNFTTLQFHSTHQILHSVKAFQGIELQRLYLLPYYWPVVKFRTQLVVMEKILIVTVVHVVV
ncbi:unnamed protein product [Thelazia callipaeda]|uniref:valine--tRNA ligase n=1 Tax=Thelazia callipaeda TaxID=103827 RepID=A0A0N5CMW1_THECL|nr:unnamed protein product [Thelazia callipaeda]